ncbi:hypothetical protein MNBD_GAMMA09-2371 [hydrothermal vent metagenome]|uniref:Response regulatory domain-containing protein n=1 Tax=hydrothermal vent metagenome TaxID=652676 RepID=A0A3B0Y1M7_9ZZZZ
MSDCNTIMIIDDSRVSRMMISAIIKSKAPELMIIEAADGKQAIELSKKNSINFFSVDLNMPGIDGIETITLLKEGLPGAKYALLTANIQDTIHKKAAQAGAKCFNKPISEECISKMLEYFNA